MPPKSKKRKKTEMAPPRAVVFFLYLAYLLVALGDGVRVALVWIIRGIIITYKKSSISIQSVKTFIATTWMNIRVAVSVRRLSLRRWIHRSIATRLDSGWRGLMSASKRKLLTRTHVHYDAHRLLVQFIARFTSKIPRIQFPKPPHVQISLPSLPRMTFPTISRRPRGRPRRLRFHPVLAFFLGSVATIIFLVIPLVAYLWLRALPNPQLLTARDIDVTTKVFDRNGLLLYEIYADQNRTPLSLSEIPKHVIQATIAIEDQQFYTHQGFSL
ncbi:transglycosylase domain-containing protein, partial [Candidatus Gottesmanbacteria bacterium]|nr:transglycosylase domain-containing protein [Candidatus Gottesmanbacteria bacterium]